MEPVNKPGKRKRGKCKNGKLSHRVRIPHKLDFTMSRQGLSSLHMACLYGELTSVRILVQSNDPGSINSSDPQGRRPVHMLMSSRSRPNTTACLRHLLENGADVNATTDSGQTPLHLAASEGLLDCTEMLVEAGADVLVRDDTGNTPLDLARIWCRRKVARYLKSCMWRAEKEKEMEERKLVQTLYTDLVDMAKEDNLKRRTLIDEKVAEWASKKGFPLLKDLTPKGRVSVSRYHTLCLSTNQDRSALKQAKALSENQLITSSKPHPISASRPWTIYMGLQPDKPLVEPDLRDRVTVWRDGGGGGSGPPQYATSWDGTPRAAPDLPLDVLERVLFPRAFPSRIVTPQHFNPQDIEEVQQRGCPQGRSSSPWTEVAMHLAEVLEPGHY